MKLTYRPEIDGLRALAIIPVLLFHAGVAGFSGGFVGVDVFFVISGYLIGSQLLQNLERGTFSFKRFYLGRARRIIPALLVVCFVSSILAFLLLHPVAIIDFSRSLLATLSFSSNILFWFDSGYFDTSSELKPLLHTWSLAIEEQFYLIAPLALLVLFKFARKWLGLILLMLALLSFGLAEWQSFHEPSTAFFLAHYRVWELLVGVLIAYYGVNLNSALRNVQYRNALVGAGLICIIISIVGFDNTTRFPGVYALLPVVGTALVIACSGESFWTRFLSARPFVWVGLISYSLYLWHQPLLAFARHTFGDELEGGVVTAVLALSVVLAVLTFRFIETPFRHGKKLSQRFKIRFMLLASLLLAEFAIAAIYTTGFPVRYSDQLLKMDAALADLNPYTTECHLSLPYAGSHPIPACSDYMAEGKPIVLIMGDSHSNAISHQLQERLAAKGLSSYAISYSSCIGIKGFYQASVKDNLDCHHHNEALLKHARESGVSKLVITSSFIGYYRTIGQPLNSMGQVEGALDVIERMGLAPTSESERRKRILDRMSLELAQLAEELDVYVVDPIPRMPVSIPEAMKGALNEGEDVDALGISLDEYYRSANDLLDMFSRLEAVGVHRVKVADVLCQDGYCKNSIDGLPLYRDEHHLTSTLGGGIVADAIVEEMGLE